MSTITLRDYQRALLELIRHHFAHGSRAPLAYGPTGMGKTVVLSYVADGVVRKGSTCCILVHRQELVTQTAMALARAGVWHNIIAPASVVRAAIKAQIDALGRSFFNSDAPATVASVQTLLRRLGSIKPFGFLLVDEAHHAVAGSWGQVIEAHPGAKMLGVTATPERMDGRGLGVQAGGVFTSMALGPSVSSLIERGFLSRPRVFAPPRQFSLEGVHSVAGDFNKGELAATMDKPTITGDAITHYRKLAEGMPAIAFCSSVAHAQHVAEQFAAAGYKAACVDGNMDDSDRRRAIDNLGSGRLDVLTSCDIVSEGTDIPVVGAAILLRPTKSLGLYLQQVGRVLRPFEGKEFSVILDHVGNCDRHGLPDDDREWSLEGRRKRKGGAKDDAGPPVRQCPACFAVFPAPMSACPSCGEAARATQREIEQREGELVEIQKAQAKNAARIEQARAQSLDDLVELAKRRGHKNPWAWANHIHSAREARRPSR